MLQSRTMTAALAFAAVAVFATSDGRAQGQGKDMQPVNDLPNPYQVISDYFKLPDNRVWGSTSVVDIDRDGRSIWVADRCGANTCLDPATGQIKPIPTVFKYDTTGKLVTSFGQGLIVWPHGIHVDREGNIWIVDGLDNVPPPAAPPGGRAGGGARTPPVPSPAATKGHQVTKFSPTGKVLLTLGKPGGSLAPGYFFQPNDVITNAAGEIFVAEGHTSIPGANARILKFTKDGKFIKEWGTYGSGPGQLDQPHGLAFDSQGRLFVADRGNNRMSIFDQDGKFLDAWYQFSRPSGVVIMPNDVMYVSDAESGTVNPAHGAWKRGIRIGSAKDGKVTAFIPDAVVVTSGSTTEGVAVDSQGNIYGAEVGPRAVRKYVKK